MKIIYLALLSGILFFAGPAFGAPITGSGDTANNSPTAESARPLNSSSMAAAVAAAKGDALLEALLIELSRS